MAKEVGPRASSAAGGVKGGGRHLERPDRQCHQLAGNLTVQLRDVSRVATAIASGDLSKKSTVEAPARSCRSRSVINTMFDQLGSFSSEVSRVAREVGTGKSGARRTARRLPVRGRTDRQRQHAGGQPHLAVRNMPKSPLRGRPRRPVQEDHRRLWRARSSSSRTPSTRWSQLSSFASEVTRVAKEVGPRESRWPGRGQGVAGTWRDLNDNVNQLAATHRAAARRSKVATAIADGRSDAEDHRRAAGGFECKQDVINT